jgi:purine-nucleoside phosphorylase
MDTADMSKCIPDYFAHDKYNIAACDVCRLILHCEPDDVREKVIITPCWNESFLNQVADSIDTVAEDMVFEISYSGQKFTLVRSGVGAPLTGDVVLALGCTPCRYIIFTGSFGGLTDKFDIGDLLVVYESIAGDGFSSYLQEGRLSARSFLKPTKPDTGFNRLLDEYAVALTEVKGVALHKDRVFCSDTIVAEYLHLDTIKDTHGCIGVEMETAAVFNAAQVVGIKAVALLMVSDVIPINKSLFSGRTKEEKARRKYVREQVLSRIILDTLVDKRLS